MKVFVLFSFAFLAVGFREAESGAIDISWLKKRPSESVSGRYGASYGDVAPVKLDNSGATGGQLKPKPGSDVWVDPTIKPSNPGWVDPTNKPSNPEWVDPTKKPSNPGWVDPTNKPSNPIWVDPTSKPSYPGQPLNPGWVAPGKPPVVVKPANPYKPDPYPAVAVPIPVPAPIKVDLKPTKAPVKINFNDFFPAIKEKEVVPIKTIFKDDKWKQWLLDNPIPQRPIYPPVYEPPTDIPPNPFGPDKTTGEPYYTEKPIVPTYTQKTTGHPPFYSPEPTTKQPHYTPEPTTKQPYYSPEPTTKQPDYTPEPTRKPYPPQPPKPGTGSRPSVYHLIQALSLNRFLHLINEAGLNSYLTGNGPVTVFVPSNEAFERLPYAFVEEIASNKESLKKFLLYHIVSGSAHTLGNLPHSQTLQLTADSGHNLNVNSYNKILTVNGVTVLQPDLGGSNGVFHIIGDCLYPYVEHNLFQVIQNDDDFSILVNLLKVAGLLDQHLTNGGPFTFFAPTNTAFGSLNQNTLKWLTDNPEQLRRYLLQYFTNGIYYTYQLKHGDSFPSLIKDFILGITKKDGYTYVNGVEIVKPDITATNGVIHVIDGIVDDIKVLGLYETLQNQGESLSYFLNVLEKAGITEEFFKDGKQYTIFAPITQAFKNLDQASLEWLLANPQKLKELLLNHFVEGVYYFDDLKDGQILYSLSKTELEVTVNQQGYKEINGQRILIGDLPFSNGNIHVIDGALFDINVQNLLETLKAQKKFTIFLQLLEKAGLIDDHLSNGGPFTLFAPTDDQLQKVDPNVLKWAFKNPEKLRAFLLQHFVNGVYYSSALTHGLQLPSVQKTTLEFTNKDGYITVNGIPVVEKDIHATNGVIHVIDGLLFKITFKNLLDTLKQHSDRFEIFLEALQNSGLIDEHLTDGGPYTVFVPTDDAFNKIDPVTLKWLLWDPPTLKALVLKHFVKDVYYYDDLENGSSLTAIGSNAQLQMADASNGQKTVNQSPISDYDLVANNGVIHAIDDVLFSKDLKRSK